jgi:hypothetical protein
MASGIVDGVPREQAKGKGGIPTPKSPGPLGRKPYNLRVEMSRLANHLFDEFDKLESPAERMAIHKELTKLVALGMRAEVAALKADRPSASKSTLLGAALGGAAIQQAMAQRSLAAPKGMNGHKKPIVTTATRVEESIEEMY